ncbi:MAG: DinB family protein [Alphaproteobacteria bacterium]|nr:DinB family protein [Alphaproteobacteria bacterium]
MIDADYVKTMARYNAWQNRSLYRAADRLQDAARRQDRGAFFGSIHATLCHVLWADRMWMSRFAGWERPEGGTRKSVEFVQDWQALTVARQEADAALLDWAVSMTDSRLSGDLTYRSSAAGREITKPRAQLVVHMFNHQTHHRGQVHAMLTAAGARPDETDLPFMPAD